MTTVCPALEEFSKRPWLLLRRRNLSNIGDRVQNISNNAENNNNNNNNDHLTAFDPGQPR